MLTRRIHPDEQSTVEAFLSEHLATSLFLLHNLGRGGLEYHGQPWQAEYLGVFRDQTLIGLAAHSWLDTLLLQAPSLEALAALEAGIPRHFSRPIQGVLGPRDQCLELMDRLSLDVGEATLDQDEPVYRLELTRLRRPALLDAPQLVIRAAREEDLPLLSRWRAEYLAEVLHLVPSARLERRAAGEVSLAWAEGRELVLDIGGQVSAQCTFTAVTPEAVQVGGLWTPPALRGRGYAATLAAGALELARFDGRHRWGVMFIDDGNRPALSACESLGFQRVGRYSFTLWDAGATPTT